MIVDMSALAFRSHYALINRPLTRSDGMVTSALFGICNTLLNVIKEFKPTHLLGALDSKEKNFRHEMFPDYKGHRPECPPELSAQLGRQEDLLNAFGIAAICHPGFEADDIVAAYTKMSQAEGAETIIFSGDKDFMQLLDDRTTMLLSHRSGQSEILKHDAVKEKVGVLPHQIADFLALMGDSADNIPGAPGVGKVTAAQLLEEYGDLETILKSTHLMKKKGLAAKLNDNLEQIHLSRRLVELNCDLPDKRIMEALRFSGFNTQKLVPFLKEMEFPKILARIGTEFSSSMNIGSETQAPIKMTILPSESATIEQLSDLGALSVQLSSLNVNSPLAIYLASDADAPVAIAVARETQVWWVRVEASDGGLQPLMTTLLKFNLISDTAKVWLKWGADSILNHLKIDDLLLMESVLNQSGRDVSLESLLAKELGLGVPDLGKSGSRKRGWADLEERELAAHLADRCLGMLPLHTTLKKAIEQKGVWSVYENMERPLMSVMANMEREGITLDAQVLVGFSGEAEGELNTLTEKIHHMAGEAFNIKSTQQLGQILFEKMKLQDVLGLKKLKKTKTGYSTDSKVLESLSGHPIGEALLRYRFLSKLKSTYMDALPKQVNEVTGRVHTTYHQNGTATGRLSSVDPNLQNIPMRVPEGARIRGAFVAKDDEYLLLAADYSQIELRVLAYFCRDEVMMEAYRNGEDIHAATAAKVFGISQDWVTPQQRSSAKAVNFGLLYGMGPKLLSQQTGLTFSEAQKFIKAYFETFPKVRAFMTEQVDKARAAGYVKTLSGRRRDLPDLESSNGMLRNAAENMALNTPIQGSAADIIKWSMLRLQQRIERENLPMKLLLQVHDELVLEVESKSMDAMKAIVREEMESLCDLPEDFDVPLTVEIGVGKTWLEAH